jgi:phosphohistidine swiveling domain-containing protein
LCGENPDKDEQKMNMVQTFADLAPEAYASAGGKGGTLARLYRAGYPVPDGFIILPAAFKDDELRPDAWLQAQAHLEQIRKRDRHCAFAVRSSALSEDSAQASFAGEFETALGTRTGEEIREAIHTVQRSRHSARVRSYSQAQRLDAAYDMAVIVQRLVPAEIAGVLFTADPVSGDRMHMAGNYVHGPGEQLVSGEANPHTFTLERPKGRYKGPAEVRRFARRLHRIASRLEKYLCSPQDIEWAIAGGRLYLLQSRPITTMQAHNPTTGEWNDSLTGDYLWTNANFGEAFPDVMTPFTWSIVERYLRANRVGREATHYPLAGNIGGRLYMNLSLGISSVAALGLPWQRLVRVRQETFGRFPSDIPLVPYTASQVLRTIIPAVVRQLWQLRKLRSRIPSFVDETPALARRLEGDIQAARTTCDLLSLWCNELEAHLDEGLQILLAGLSEYRTLSRKLHIKFEKLVGDADANALLSGVSSGDDALASLGLLMGLLAVGRGELTREEYLQAYGHRGPHEMEFSIPPPSQDPGWLDRRLAELEGDEIDVPAMLARQRERHQAAWERLEAQVSVRQAKACRQRLDRLAIASKTREAVRSEAVRLLGVYRAFALRAGDLTGLEEDIFFLSLEEMLAALSGDKSAHRTVPARKEAHARYRSLPPYPPIVRGRFDPVEWAKDPNRRADIYNADEPTTAPISDAITGFAGAAGIVEGVVRRLDSPEEGNLLQPGEILVTVTTNVGWTPLFSRAAAIVTDVGAPFSHAAIVARELGIPAVVGCGNATMNLHSGDRVRVNGGQGTVEVLDPVSAIRGNRLP